MRHPVMPAAVWIVLQDKYPTNSVLGVFATQEEAHDFAESPEVAAEWETAVIYASFPVGYRYNQPRR